jgi:ATP-dependent helicase/nuclease subunit A
METGNDAVRVMTVHAAKGLEAKIVFNPDTCSVPAPRHDPKIFVLDTTVAGEQAMAWSPNKDFDWGAVAAARETAREAAMEEYRRLLYVALSRAEERLYIAGFNGAKDPDERSWANMIEAALANQPGIEKVPAFWNSEDRILRFASEVSAAPASLDFLDNQAAAASLVLPEWLGRHAPAEPEETSSITPWNALAEKANFGATQTVEATHDALRRGRLIHLLLQYLPGIASLLRLNAALDFLSARAPHLDETAHQKLAQEVLDVIALPELAGLFGPDSKAEVSIAGRIALGTRIIDVAGRVDRIGENDKEILVADFKTGTPCPLDDTPAAHRTQMALYHAVLAPLWPQKTLRMGLIWTAGPCVVWLPAAMLDAAFVALAAG